MTQIDRQPLRSKLWTKSLPRCIMQDTKLAFETEKSAMYMMPRIFPQNRKRFAALSVLVLLMLAFLAGLDASAQVRKKRPATTQKTQQQSTANQQTPQQKPPQKKITPLHSSDTADGSRITIRADAPLNDYSAYRSGDRYYVVIPEASAPAAQGGMRGRGFEDVQVQKRGTDTVLSFKLQPGTNARVSQRFDKLDVELTAPGGSGANNPQTTGRNGTPQTPTASPTPRATPQTAITQPTNPATGATGQTINPTLPLNSGANNPAINPPITGANPTVVYAPSPEVAASPGTSPEANPAQSPATEEIAQAQQPPAQQSGTTSAPTSGSPSLGAVLQQNWLIILIGALVLASLVMIVAARSRAQRTATTTTPVRRSRRERKRAAKEEAAAELPEADTSSAVTAASSATAVAATQPEVDVEGVASAVVAAEAARAIEAEETSVEEMPTVEAASVETPTVETPSAVAEETKEIEVAQAFDGEQIDTEVKNVLTGESYDEAVIGSRDAGTRQLVATELLSALAARNVERRERAREAFIKHDYLDEATKNLRTADAPAERAAAARALGYVKDSAATAHLIAALEDEAPEVRRASVEALADLRDPSALEPLQELLKRERDRKVPKNLIKSAIEASTAVEEVEETPTLEAEEPSITDADLASTGIVSGFITTAPPVLEEVETAEDEASALREAEEAATERERAEAEERRRAEEEQLRAEEEARQQAEAQARAEEEARRQAEEERLRVEAEARAVAEEEARRIAAEEEAARVRAEEEAARQREEAERKAAEEEAARLKAEEEAARLRAEEEARLQAEQERLRAEEEARLKAEEEARRLAAEEEQRRAEAEAKRQAEEEAARLRAEEEERLRVEAEARARAEEKAARLRAEEEERQRLEAETAQKRAEEEARLQAEEEAARLKAEEEAAAASTLAPPIESLFERNDETAAGWFEVEMSDPEVVRYDEEMTVPSVEEEQPELFVLESELAEPVATESKEIEPTDFQVVEEPVSRPVTKEIDYAVTEKGIATLDEFSTVPAAILRRLSSEEPTERAAAVTDLARVGGEDSFREISAAFDDPDVAVRNAAARSLYELKSDRAATFTRALREAPPDRRRKIGAALASSGLASEAIGQLMGESREKTYDAFSLLFLMSKAGEVQPLMRAIEEHPNNEVRLAVVKLLALSGQQDILPAFRRLAVRGSLPTEVRSAVMEAIYQISSQPTTA